MIEKFDGPRVKLLWRAPIASGYSGPTVAGGLVYVSDRLVEPRQMERVHCFDAASGKKRWTHEYPCRYSGIGYTAGPRAAVTLDDGRAFALGAMGDFHCLDAKSGKVLWKKDLLLEYQIRMPNWGIASAPLVVDDLVILQIGGRGACLVAFDKESGKEKWTALDDRTSYAAPILVGQGDNRQLVCWTGDSVAALQPASGKEIWKFPFRPRRMVIGIATPVVDNGRLFVTSFYDGSLMLKLPQGDGQPQSVWRRAGRSERETDALHSIMSTPLMRDGHVYGVDSYGELRCLKADSGDRLWEDKTATPPTRWSNIHMVTNAGKVWMFNEAGELVISKLSPSGFEEISRAKLIDPTREQLRRRDGVCWSHPAFAYKHVFARNDKEIVCANLAE